MLIRAFIVLLVFLNLGTALWWLNQSPPLAPAPVVPVPAGVARLEWLPGPASAPPPAVEAPVTPTPAPAVPADPKPSPAAAPPEAAPPKPVVNAQAAEDAKPAAAQCASFGPYADRSAAQAAVDAMGSGVSRPRIREVTRAGGSSYRVMLPAAASREDAQALVKRIAQAGLSDYFIIASGDEANAVALGQYRNKEGADRRLAQVQAAGFNAVLLPSTTSAAPSFWVDAALAAGGSSRQLASTAKADQSQSLDCAGLR